MGKPKRWDEYANKNKLINRLELMISDRLIGEMMYSDSVEDIVMNLSSYEIERIQQRFKNEDYSNFFDIKKLQNQLSSRAEDLNFGAKMDSVLRNVCVTKSSLKLKLQSIIGEDMIEEVLNSKNVSEVINKFTKHELIRIKELIAEHSDEDIPFKKSLKRQMAEKMTISSQKNLDDMISSMLHITDQHKILSNKPSTDLILIHDRLNHSKYQHNPKYQALQEELFYFILDRSIHELSENTENVEAVFQTLPAEYLFGIHKRLDEKYIQLSCKNKLQCACLYFAHKSSNTSVNNLISF